MDPTSVGICRRRNGVDKAKKRSIVKSRVESRLFTLSTLHT